ncbi:hypothetical protein P7C71_g3269, partial [Lecanoromycetidae sp. Uapishka_2]
MVAQEMDPVSGTSSTSSASGETPEESSASSAATTDIPVIDEQIKQVMELIQQPMQEGQTGYLVATKWLHRVMARGSSATGLDKYGKEAREGTIGPVDNSGINMVTDPSTSGFKDERGEDYVPLKPGLQFSDDYEVFPQGAWDLMLKWYGLAKGSPIIKRYCHNASTSETQDYLQYEINLPTFTILKLPDPAEGMSSKFLKERDATPIKILASRHERYQNFLKRAKESAGIELKTKVRVWRILGGLGGSSQGAGMLTPAQSRSASPAPGAVAFVDPGEKLVLDANTFAGLQLGTQREEIEARDETANEKYNGRSTLDFVGLRQDEVIVLEEQIGGIGGGEWVSDNALAKARQAGVPISVTKSGTTTVQNASLKPGAHTSRSSSPAAGGMMTRGRQAKNGRVHDKYKKELNPGNPLSHGGNVAKSYANLLHEIYNPSSLNSLAPRNFKNTIGKYGPSFSGYGQQDSQEFLLFLLDSLQEDLNRIHKKPYIEKPDSTDEMVNDPVALRGMADKCWDIYKARNDSVITDLFAGMYKSTVVCPVCDKVSIIFDPFNNLTLQLPIESLWSRKLFFFPVHGDPMQVSIDIDKNATFMALKEYVGHKFKVNPKRLICAEEYKHKFYKTFDDKSTLGEENIQDADHVGIWELEDQPTNFPQPRNPASRYKATSFYNNASDEEPIPDGETPLDEKMLITVFHRREASSRYQRKELFAYPTFIVVNREEAKDYDSILRKVLARAATMTHRDFLQEAQDMTDRTDSTTEDSDTVLMSTEEAEYSSDSRVQAKSLESEDGMVDISMDNSEDTAQAAISLSGSGPIHKILQPGSSIPANLRNLFEMKYLHSNGREMVPVGISVMGDESRNFPTVASRQQLKPSVKPKPSLKDHINRRQQRLDSPPSSDEDAEESFAPTRQQDRAQESESDDDGLPPVAELTKPNGGFGMFSKGTPRNDKGLITYSRKGKQPLPRRQRQASSPSHEDVPLLKLGDSIIVDWTDEGQDALFGGTSGFDDEMRGLATFDSIPLLPDPELEEKRKIRSSRRRNGVSLGDCLDEFGKPEVLSENDAWYCPRCKEHRRASKTFELWKAPDILVVHLKRFSAQGRLRDKLDVLVDFPVEGLDLSTRLAVQEDGKSPMYDLFAVDNHYGGLGGGHYTAYAQNFNDGQWYEYNESQPTSRATSPAGEGKRLDGSSRNGSSSALRGLGAAHQAGVGGANGTVVSTRTGVDDDLPPYSTDDPLRSTINPQELEANTLESMELDGEGEVVDEGIGDMSTEMSYHGTWNRSNYSTVQNWSFGDYGTQNLSIPPNSDNGDVVDENLFGENSSTKVANSSVSDAGENRMADFDNEDVGTTSGAFGTPEEDAIPLLDVPPAMEEIEQPVQEVMLEDDHDAIKMD